MQVYASGRYIGIEGAKPAEEVRLYDLNGRCLLVTRDHTFDAPARGVIILTVAGRTFKFAI